MTPERWQQLKQIFSQSALSESGGALGISGVKACADDQPLPQRS